MPGDAEESFPSRHIHLDGPVNFRDLGGYPAAEGRTVRWRMIFRSDGLDSLTPADLAHLVEELGLASVIDLRSGDEVEAVGRGLLGGTELAFHHIPILDETRRLLYTRGGAGLTIGDLYREMAERSGDRFVAALRVVAATDSPIVFHCAAGKDRTGMLGALLLDLLGVGDEHIADDYAQSARITSVLRQRLEALRAAREVGGSTSATGGASADRTSKGRAQAADELLSALPATIMGVLAAIRAEHGSVEHWAQAHGLPDAELARLRGRLLN